MPKTYNDLYLATRTALKNAGVEAYALEARLLVAYAVGKTKEEFVRDLRLYTSDENEQKIEALLQRRIAGEPLAISSARGSFTGCRSWSRPTCSSRAWTPRYSWTRRCACSSAGR